MSKLLDKLTDRVLSWIGLDTDFSLDMEREALSQITPTLYLGGRPPRERVPAMKEVGITHVVSCLDDAGLAKVAFLEDDFRALRLCVHDGIEVDIASSFGRVFDFAAAAQRSPGARVFVHCEAGVSRSATLVIALVMQSDRQRFFDVYREVRSRRPEVLPNIGFASQLQRLEQTLLPGARTEGGLSSLARYLRETCHVPIEVEILEETLQKHDHDALRAIRAIYGDDIPRVIQGVRV